MGERLYFPETAYNYFFNGAVKESGGKWDPVSGRWYYPDADLVEDLYAELLKKWFTDYVKVEITATRRLRNSKITWGGYTIARAFSRDGTPKLGAVKISGKVSGAGSRRSPEALIDEGSVFRLKVPRGILETFEDDDWATKIIDEGEQG